MAKHKQPLIKYLIENYYKDEDEVKKAVKLGIVSVNSKLVKRPGIDIIPDEDKVEVVGDSYLFVSRGGYKLQKALKLFEISPKDKICLDVGSSTGGFTDCLLQYGAELVYAVDTGYNQLDWSLRKHAQVRCHEKTNIRYLLPDKLYTREELDQNQKASLVVVDVSFISVLKLIPSIQRLAVGPEKTDLIVLIKPQFEAGKDNVGRGGIVKNPSIHFEILHEFIHGCFRAGLDLENISYSPILGGAGNLEFIAHLTWPEKGRKFRPNLEEYLQKTVDIAYEDLGLL